MAIDAYKDKIYKLYPLPCQKECDLKEPCVLHKSCSKWVSVDFCRWRDIRKYKRERQKRIYGYESWLKSLEKWMKRRGI